MLTRVERLLEVLLLLGSFCFYCRSFFGRLIFSLGLNNTIKFFTKMNIIKPNTIVRIKRPDF